MKECKYQIGDNVCAKLFSGKIVEGIITYIGYDDFKKGFIADLSCGNWCYLEQILNKR